MAEFVKKAYMAIMAVLAILLVYYLIFYRSQITPGRAQYAYEILVPIEVTESDENVKDGGGRQTILVQPDRIEAGYCTLMFYSIHQSVVVYDEADEVLYSMRPARKNTFTRTPGCVWNSITLQPGQLGQELRLELTNVYPGISYDVPEIYYGEKGAIVAQIMKTDIPVILTSLVLMAIGLIYAGFVLYNYKNSEVDKNLGMLGIFAFQVGLWKLFDLSATKILFWGYPIVSTIPFVALLMLVIPCVFFYMEQQESVGEKYWLFPCWVSIAVIYLSLFLQLFNLADFRQLFPLICVAILLAVAMVAGMSFLEYKRSGWNARLRRNLVGFGIIIVGVLVDLGTYLFSGGRNTSSFTIVAFLAYTLILGYVIFQESGALMQAGESAQSLEDKAYHDKMTGCFNRAAFIVDTDPYAVSPDGYVIAVMDLNNLKKCNDTFGHDKGDLYIRESAKIILDTFGKIGNCYRMGGDEFYVIIPKGGLTACKEQKAEMEKRVAEYNAKSGDIHMSIACGFAKYDKRLDYDLNATAKRADSLMYTNKAEMKKAEAKK